MIYTEGLTDKDMIGTQLLTPLMKLDAADGTDPLVQLVEKAVPVAQVKAVSLLGECVDEIGKGQAILLAWGEKEAVSLSLGKAKQRSVEEPQAEPVIRGPREGFTETLSVNLSLLRRKIRSPLLKSVTVTVGAYTKTDVVLVYIEGLADPKIIQHIQKQIENIEIDGILESSYIEEFISEYRWSPFPEILNTERPDTAASHLLEGRIVILVSGTPVTLIVPITFASLLQSSEDYYQEFISGTTIRWLRYGFLLISLFLPSFYIALVSYHQEMIPTVLFFSIANSREGIPFPAAVEALIMEVTFEALREAGTRLPKQAGSAVSIVGALVIGQAAVQAGIVSAPMVIVVALTGIASFMIPHYALGIPIRLLRFPLMLLAAILGLLGLLLGLIGIVTHLCTMRPFGIPYFFGATGQHVKDVLMRPPWPKMNTRPSHVSDQDRYRQPQETSK